MMRSVSRPVAAVAAAFALLMSVAAPSAQAAPKGPQGDGPLVKLMDVVSDALAKVDLSDDQKTQTHTILEDARAQIVAIRDAAKADKGDKDARKELREKAMKIVKQTREKLEGVLTPEQKKAFRAALKDAREEARDEREGKKDDKPTTRPAK